LTTNFFKLSLLISLMIVGTDASGQRRTRVKPSAQDVVESRSLDPGQLDGVNYSNNFFGLTLSIPPTWVVVTAQRNRTVMEQSGKVVTGNRKKKKEIVESVQRSLILFSLTKVPAGEPDNASLMLIAERLPSPSVKTGADVIQRMKNAFTGTNVSIEFQGDTQTERIGSADFAVVTVKNTSPSGIFMQKIYVTTKNGYALQLFYTYQNDADLATLNSIVGTMKMK
jgi:hypothetical protein